MEAITTTYSLMRNRGGVVVVGRGNWQSIKKPTGEQEGMS
jgi:hypothetical protein